jgi:hypothetical protein
VNLLILVVDDEPDVEMLFRQRFLPSRSISGRFVAKSTHASKRLHESTQHSDPSGSNVSYWHLADNSTAPAFVRSWE